MGSSRSAKAERHSCATSAALAHWPKPHACMVGPIVTPEAYRAKRVSTVLNTVSGNGTYTGVPVLAV